MRLVKVATYIYTNQPKRNMKFGTLAEIMTSIESHHRFEKKNHINIEILCRIFAKPG